MKSVVRKFEHALSSLRGEARDTSAEHIRSRARNRRMLYSAVAAASAKVIAVGTQLISIPLTLHYLGAERYGMWLTLSSFIAVLAFADFGIGNGLMSRVASAHGRDDYQTIRKYVSSSLATLLLISFALVLLSTIVSAFISWDSLFNVKSALAITEARSAAIVFSICLALTIPVSLVQKVQTGLQMGFVSSMWNGVSNLLALVGVFISTQFQLGLPWLVFSFMGAPLIVGLINFYVFFFIQRPDLSPTLSHFSRSAATEVGRTGMLFFTLQILASISYSSDPIIISHVLGPSYVPQYSVPERMFSIVGMIVAMGLGPLWPAYGEALSRNDTAWAAKALRRSIGAAVLVAGSCSIAIAIAGPTLLHLWVGKTITATPAILVGLALWKIIEAAGQAIATFLNGARVVHFQVAIAAITCAAMFAGKIVLIEKLGVYGGVWATIIAYTIFSIAPASIRLNSLLDHISRREMGQQ